MSKGLQVRASSVASQRAKIERVLVNDNSELGSDGPLSLSQRLSAEVTRVSTTESRSNGRSVSLRRSLSKKAAIASNGSYGKEGRSDPGSLTDSTEMGKPDIEALDISSRLDNINNIFEVTNKPLIMDFDTGGKPEHFAFAVKSHGLYLVRIQIEKKQ